MISAPGHALSRRGGSSRDRKASVNRTTAYDVIVRLRPEFVSTVSRDTHRSPIEPVVYVNGLEAGGLSVLRGIVPEMIAEVRWVSPSDAYMHHARAI